MQIVRTQDDQLQTSRFKFISALFTRAGKSLNFGQAYRGATVHRNGIDQRVGISGILVRPRAAFEGDIGHGSQWWLYQAVSVVAPRGYQGEYPIAGQDRIERPYPWLTDRNA